MIPKIIHYVWLGGNKKSPSVKRCIDSWKKVMPDYEIKEWNENNFDLDTVNWTKESILKKKWSLASDYIRHYAIYTEGGIYMDTDVMVYKRFDEFLVKSFFTSIELHPKSFAEKGVMQLDGNGLPFDENKCVAGMGLLAACFGAEKGNVFIKECLDYFGNRHYINQDGSLYEDEINPGIMAKLLLKYNFRYKDEKQFLAENMIVLTSNVFAGDPQTRTKHSYAMHFMDNSWKKKNLWWQLKDFIKMGLPSIFRK